VEDDGAVSVAPNAPAVWVLAPYDLLLRFPSSVPAARLPHAFTLASDDGAVTRRVRPSQGQVEADVVALWFTDLSPGKAYRLTSEGDESPKTIIDYTPYPKLASKSASLGAAKLPESFYGTGVWL
jgi:hypothetical protein